MEDDEYRVYIGGIMSKLQDYFPDALFMIFNFREGIERYLFCADLIPSIHITSEPFFHPNFFHSLTSQAHIDIQGKRIHVDESSDAGGGMSWSHNLHSFVVHQGKMSDFREALNLHSLSGSSSVEWGEASQKQPLIWYKAFFNAPDGEEPLALDMNTMGKGQVWINGQSIGRYWPGYKASGSCGECDYRGTYDETKCQTNCGEASQRWYHVPRSWLLPTGNLMVVFEEWGGDPTGISMMKRSIGSVCADVSEWQPSMKNWHTKEYGKSKVHLFCDEGQKITQIKFASFGTPQGVCGRFSEGTCHAHKSYNAFEKNCIGQQSCSVAIVPKVFGGDPCPGTMKSVAVEAICG